MMVLAVRSGAAGAARYLKPDGEPSAPANGKGALTKVRVVLMKTTEAVVRPTWLFVRPMYC